MAGNKPEIHILVQGFGQSSRYGCLQAQVGSAIRWLREYQRCSDIVDEHTVCLIDDCKTQTTK
jgi:hypothetical protein